ncbi:MAG: SDR family oxidoreductase [Deltaproteobacteria bacterium]|nr:SDR family oxidoreductase [Deltaproteobacteria bacterium]MBW2362748.1 SDR family oxidoreductase [Deltaproteobacteria bacterium]
MPRLTDKVALISGAGSGIGRASALRFAEEGARVVIAEIDPALGKAAADAVRAAGGEACFVETDVTVDEKVERCVAAALEAYGRLDVLFNCAGGSLEADAPITEVDPAVIEPTLALNLKSTLLCCRHGIPELVRAGGGSVINTSSVVALRGDMPLHVYSAAKGAILSLTRSLAGSYGEQGVRVNAICPGMVLTERILRRADANAGSAPLLEGHPFAVGQPVDIANVALFLASDESRMVTGAVIPAEGGLSAF